MGRLSRIAFTGLVAGVAGLRIAELRLSARNERALLARGGQVHAAGQMPWMRALHTGWFVAMLAEVWGTRVRMRPGWALAGLAGLGAGMAVRRASQQALGERWTATVVTLPGARRMQTGVYRTMRHPNYAGVVAEIAAVPLIHGAWRTAALFSALNALMLRARIRAEDRALDAAAALSPGDPAGKELHGL